MGHIDTPEEWLAFITGIGSAIITSSIIFGFLYRKIIRPLNNVIKKELTPNGGTSIKDTIDRLEEKLDNTIALQLNMSVELLEHIRDADKHYRETHHNE